MNVRAAALGLIGLVGLGSCLVSVGDVESPGPDGGAGQGASGGWPDGAGGSSGSQAGTTSSGGSAGAGGASGSAGAGGAPPTVVVHTGLSSLVGITAEASFPAVQMDQSVLFMGRTSNSASPHMLLLEGELTSSTTAEFRRFEALGEAAAARWYVVEHSNLSVQRGQIDLVGPNEIVTLPSSVDPARSMVLVSHRAGGMQVGGNDFVTGKLVGPVSLDLRAADGGLSVVWQVAEFTDATRVQHRSITLSAGSDAANVTIDAVDPARSFVLLSYRLATNTAEIAPADGALSARVTAGAVEVRRAIASNLVLEAEVSVVELEHGSAQHVPLTLPPGTLGGAIRTVAKPATSIAFMPAWGWGGTSLHSAGDAFSEAFAAAAFGTGEVLVERGTMVSSAELDVQIVDFVP